MGQLIPPQETNVYTENRVITFSSEPTQLAYSKQNMGGYVTSQVVQDTRYIDSKDLIGLPERNVTYEDTEQLAATPDSARQMVQTSDSARQMVQTPDSVTQMIQTPDSVRQMVQTADSARQMVQTPDPQREMVLPPNARPSYNDRNIVAVPSDTQQQVITTTNANAPIVLVPDANIRPIVSPQHVNTRNLISAVIDSTRLAMPAALSNSNTRQIISTGNDTTLRQPLPVQSAINKPVTHNVDANMKQIMVPNPIQGEIEVTPAAGDNRQYILRPDGTLRIVSAPQMIDNQEVVGYTADKRNMESPVGHRFVESKEIPVMFTTQGDGSTRYVQGSEVILPTPAPTMVENKSILHQEHAQPETATCDQNKPAQYSEYSTRFVNSSGGETVPMSHAIVSNPENGPALASPMQSSNVAKNLDERHQGVHESFSGDVNDVGDALKVAAESSGIVPPPLAVVPGLDSQHQAGTLEQAAAVRARSH